MVGPDCGECRHSVLPVGDFDMSGHGYYLDAGHYDPNWFAISVLGLVALIVLIIMIVDKLFSEDSRVVHRFNKLKRERLVWEDIHDRHAIPQTYGTHLAPDIINRQLEGQ